MLYFYLHLYFIIHLRVTPDGPTLGSHLNVLGPGFHFPGMPSRSSCSKMFSNTNVLKNFANFTTKHLRIP